MGLKKSCLSCKYNYDMGVKPSSNTWCLLRKIKLCSDLSDYVFCHHWTKQDKSFQSIEDQVSMIDQQLDFARDLVVNDI